MTVGGTVPKLDDVTNVVEVVPGYPEGPKTVVVVPEEGAVVAGAVVGVIIAANTGWKLIANNKENSVAASTPSRREARLAPARSPDLTDLINGNLGWFFFMISCGKFSSPKLSSYLRLDFLSPVRSLSSPELRV